MTTPVAFLLGAGASHPYGIPMMVGFYDDFRAYIERRHHHCFKLLTTLEANGGHPRPDLETLLSDLQSVLGIESGLSVLGKAPGTHDEVAIAIELRGYLDAFIMDRCERFEHEKASRELPALLALRQVAPVWVFSTNYDRIIEHACEANGVPWTDGFQSDSSQAVVDWSNEFAKDIRIVKLHGSVNWYEDDPGGAIHRLDRGYSLPAHDFRLQRGSQVLRPLMIIPTLEKGALRSPYIGLAMRFTDILKETRLLIVAGNSLRDKHVRAYVQERLAHLHVLLVSPSAGQNREILGNVDRTHALNAGFSEFLTLGGVALLRLATEVSAATDDTAVHAAVEKFISEVSRDVSDETAVRGDPQMEALWKQLGSSSASRRIEALKALSKYSHPAILRRINTALAQDASPAVRVAAVDMLTRMAGKEASAALEKALSEDVIEDVQLEAALALRSLGVSEGSRAALAQRLARPNVTPALRTVLDETLGASDATRATD
jgi:hypothetical protein